MTEVKITQMVNKLYCSWMDIGHFRVVVDDYSLCHRQLDEALTLYHCQHFAL